MDLGEPPAFPSIRLPEAPQLPRPVLEVPRADLPTYKPLVVPPQDLRPPPGIQGEPKEEPPQETLPFTPPIPQPIKPPEVNFVEIPGTDFEVPVPSNEILVTAVSTATVSVAATLTATAVFKRLVSLFKPVIKLAWTKLTKKKTLSDSSFSSGPPDS